MGQLVHEAGRGPRVISERRSRLAGWLCPPAAPLLALLLAVSSLAEARAPSWLPSEPSARRYAEQALRTQRYTDRWLAVPWTGERCWQGGFLAYRREVGTRLSDAWYDAAQLMADAALVRLGQRERLCHLDRTTAFLDLVARPGLEQGFYPRADIDGRNVTTRDTYADDNAFIGLALLAARDVSQDSAQRAALLRRAEAAARYLTDGGLWDETFGGGFWWNSNRGRTAEGKPAQTTALAAQLFARLYQQTADPRYAEWSHRSLAWLRARLRDPASGLYLYTLRHWDLSSQSGEYLDPSRFNYDQAIMIEVHLLFEAALEPGGGHLSEARALAETTQATFWQAERGYRLEASRSDVYIPYAAWLTPALLELHAIDPDPRWLSWARANLDALEATLRDRGDDGYPLMQYRCQAPTEPGCEHGADWVHDPTRLLYSQAMMQRAQALLAARIQP